MASITQQLPAITNKDKYSLFVAMRDYYEKIGQYLPTKYIQSQSPPKVIGERKAPKDITMVERRIWAEIPEEYNYYHKSFKDVPLFIGNHFAKNYIEKYKTKGAKLANTYLRESGLNRCNQIRKEYDIKCGKSLIAQEFYKNLTNLPYYEQSDADDLGNKIANYMLNLICTYLETDEYQLKANNRTEQGHDLEIYQFITEQLQPLNLDPPYFDKYKKQTITTHQVEIALAKVSDPKWWQRKLNRRRYVQREHLAIAAGQVQRNASPYASRTCINEKEDQKRKNRDFLSTQCIENAETGEQLSLLMQVDKSVSNPKIRRCELMNRMRGFEDLANHYGYVGAFITLTAPSKYHSVHSKGGFVKNWSGNTPQDTQRYLCGVWAKIRAKLNRDGVSFFGFRVAEPHHDGTPHWHILIFMDAANLDIAFKTMWIYAMDEDGAEKGAALNRFEFTRINQIRGSATGYIAKYISKNIDGYALDDEKDDETGQKLQDMAKSVTAWASRWRIRQFQQLGGAPVTVWRELRRLKDQKVNDENIDPVLAAASVAGCWATYTEQQGGAMVKRKDLKVRVTYEESLNEFEEPIKKINGIFSPIIGMTSFICTRLIKWIIVKKDKLTKSLDLKNRAERTPWSSVNNCTRNFQTLADDQREQIRKQLKIIGLPDDDLTINQLYLRKDIKISQNQYLKLDNTLNGVHLIVTNSPTRPKSLSKKDDWDSVVFDF